MSGPTICEVRLWISADTRVDVQLPGTTPLGVVLGDVETYLREFLDAAGSGEELPDVTHGWRLRTPIGTLLDNEVSLDAQNVRSGSALTLIANPDGEQFSPRVESVSAAVAGMGRKLYAPITPARLGVMLSWFVAATVAVCAALLLIAAFRSRSTSSLVGVGGVTAVILGCWAVGRRLQRPQLSAAGSLLAVLFVPPAASLLIPASFGPWSAPHLLLAAVTEVVLAIAIAASGRYLRAAVAGATVAGFTALSQVASWHELVPSPMTRCVLVVVLVVLLGRAELVAGRLAGLPVSMFPSGSGRFIGRRASEAVAEGRSPVPPDPARLLSRAVRANEVLTGLLTGLSIAAAALTGLIVATSAGAIGWLAFAAGLPVLFAYRCWSYVGAANVACLLVGVFGSIMAGAVAAVGQLGLVVALAVLGGAAALSLVAPWAVPTEQRPHSPVVRAVRAVSEHVVTAAVLLAPLLLLRIPQMVYNRDFG